jgi:hypothetical protein
MLRRPAVIVVLLVISVMLLWLWWESRLPPGIEPQGDIAYWQEWVKLIGGIVAILGGMIGVIDKLLDMFRKKHHT